MSEKNSVANPYPDSLAADPDTTIRQKIYETKKLWTYCNTRFLLVLLRIT